MASGDRFYLMDFRHRPVLNGDVGSLLRIEGLVVGGGGAHKVLLLPGTGPIPIEPLELTEEQWCDWLQRSDQPEIMVGLQKIFQRKVRYEISGAIQQKVWAADQFKCRYCNVGMGKALLTIDHLVPLEMGGANNTTNFITACKSCNKDKGSEDPEVWLKRRGLDLGVYKQYLADRKI